MAKNVSRVIFLMIVIAVLSGCAMKFESSWREAEVDQPTPQSEALVKQAQSDYEQADDRASLLTSIDAYKKVLSENPGDYIALVALSNQHILLATAYTEECEEKSAKFRLAMKYAELAMYTNREFKTRVIAGTDLWDAADSLNKEQVEAMFFWVTALQYEFKESMGLTRKIVNVSWMEHALKFLNRVEQVAPDYGGGAVEVAKVICYYVLPGFKGGSEQKGDAYMARAVAKGENWLMPRWARGKYYYEMKGEEQKAREDLEWVANQDATQFNDPFAWKIHFQDDARTLLR
jgi:hypothetical protein